MVLRSSNARTMQTRQRSREGLWFCQVLVSGPMTALAAASPQHKVTIFGRRTSGSYGGHKEGPQGRKGSISPLHCVECRTINSPLELIPTKWKLILIYSCRSTWPTWSSTCRSVRTTQASSTLWMGPTSQHLKVSHRLATHLHLCNTSGYLHPSVVTLERSAWEPKDCTVAGSMGYSSSWENEQIPH